MFYFKEMQQEIISLKTKEYDLTIIHLIFMYIKWYKHSVLLTVMNKNMTV